MSRCPFCDHDVPTGLVHCPSCGAELSESAVPAAEDDLDAELLDLLSQGNKIAAIRRHRERTGSGLKESKDAVEALAVRHGLPAKGPGCFGVLLIAVSAGAAGMFAACVLP